MRRKHCIKQHLSTKKIVIAIAFTTLLTVILAGMISAKNVWDIAFPLEGAAYVVSDGYGWRKDPFDGQKRFHAGVDLACTEGTAVLAVADGVVLAATNGTSYGNYIRICHDHGIETLYAHLQYLYVRPGEIVRTGQQVGTAGQTGRATGSHLHFSLYKEGSCCDPSELLGVE